MSSRNLILKFILELSWRVVSCSDESIYDFLGVQNSRDMILYERPKLLDEEDLLALLKLIKSAKYDTSKNYPLIIVSPTPRIWF